jgi:putative transposase
MPNHIHGILCITECPVGTRHAVPLQNHEQFGKPVTGSIPTIIRSFKSAVTKRINEICHTPGNRVWQSNYYEHVIRSHDEWHWIREYIKQNPEQWGLDREQNGIIQPGSIEYI